MNNTTTVHYETNPVAVHSHISYDYNSVDVLQASEIR